MKEREVGIRGNGEMGRKQFKIQPSKIQNLGRGCEECGEWGSQRGLVGFQQRATGVECEENNIVTNDQ
ncbi:hypothetical protein CEN44_26745 [Fischerella muscicola CCMEE 5323]|uniref:Uncharacterized protein n=1 Tax=Fischerella muscicola CCMEE 5323 TaxID=2019572 RepID=A0A2N6JVI1_FISMU|nr:hypothetical protein CEN44_26745 [Fischerella muscicola CCMEE 5323]